jgi:hypothetical protein
LEAKYDPSDSS